MSDDAVRIDEERLGRAIQERDLVPWDELPEPLKESLRAEARRVPDRLAAIGCRLEAAGDQPSHFTFTDDEVDRLAEKEHDRWWLEQVVDDWKWGAQKSPELRTSPDLVPWSALSAAAQDRDRAAVRVLPDALASAGFVVVRIGEVVAPPDDLVTLLDGCVPAFMELRPQLDELGRQLTKRLRELASVPSPTAIVTTRTKSVSGFVEKIVRKYPKYGDPLREITDLCGVRVIARTRTEADAIAHLIEAEFDIDRANSVSHTDRLHPSEFGYRSVHYIVKIPRDVDPGEGDDGRHTLTAEVQLRTVAEHASADFDHDFSYKGAFTLPDRWQRELAIIAAQVETIDEAFVRIEDGLRVYASTYGAYLDPDQLRAEIAKLRVMCRFAPENPELVTRLSKLLRAGGEVKGAQQVLDEYCTRRPEEFSASQLGQPQAALLRELGDALCTRYADGSNNQELMRGRATLERASGALTAPGDRAEAFACLGDSWGHGPESRHWYELAFAADPVDPHTLTRYAEAQIAAGTPDVVAMLKPAVDLAVARCRAQIEVGVNLPSAFAVLGELLMLQGDTRHGLDCYAKALRSSTSRHLIDDALEALDVLTAAPSTPHELEQARRMLALGAVIHFGSAARAAELVGLATRDEGRLRKIPGPVVVVVAGTTPSLPNDQAFDTDLMIEAFKDFAGTIMSGGTEHVSGGIVGLVGTHNDDYRKRITTIRYVPETLPTDGAATGDARCTEIRVGDPLQMWIDLFASGIRADEVTVLGINGGAEAAFELRVALSLGARVGVIQHTGRDVDTLLVDAEWKRLLRQGTADHITQLASLPDDSQTVRAFIGVGEPQLSDADREKVGRMVHDAYRERARQSYPNADPAMQEFDRLPDYLRASNLRQADHIFAKLREIGCDVVPIAEAPPFDGFDEREVERLSEMEHGRWNAEKLAEGFVWGEHKDDIARTHPYLVTWARLPETIRELDRAAVHQIPSELAAIGLTITRRPASRKP